MSFSILNWTDSEVAILKEFYPSAPYSELEKMLPNRKKAAMVAKASKLHVKRIAKVWTKKELKLLKKYYPSEIDNEELLALLPNHSFYAIKTKAKLYGLKRGNYIPGGKGYMGRRWTKDELEILKLYYNSMDDDELLVLLPGRTLMGMKHIARNLKLGLKDGSLFKVGELWTNSEDGILSENFNVLPNEELMRLLPGRTLCGIKARAQKLGIKRDKNIWGSAGYYRPWKQNEIDILSKNWNNLSLEDLSKLIESRTENGLLKQAKKMGLPRYDRAKFKKPRKK